MKDFSWSDFKPTILFLLKFAALYLLLSVSYGLFVKASSPAPDSATVFVTHQTTSILKSLGWEASATNSLTDPTTIVSYHGRQILSVYEGCNGINVVIIFLCFLFAFGPINRKILWFALVGILTIHVANLARVLGLFWIVIYVPDASYFTHKYLFTAIIYVVVFLLWMLWLRLNFKDKA